MMDEPRRKTPMLPKSIPIDLGTLRGIGVGAALAVIAIVLINTLTPPARLTIDSAPPADMPTFAPTYAAPTAAPVLAATSQPPTPAWETVTPDPPYREVELMPPPPAEPPPPIVEEVQAVEVPPTPLVFVQGVCAEWHPPQVYPEGCP